MKKLIAGSVLLFLIFSSYEIVCAKSLELKKKTGEHIVEIKLERNPPITGDNKIEILIKNSQGEIIRDLAVLVNYYMLPMPRMAPMNYTVPAKFYKNDYRASLKFIMSGPWIIAVKMTRTGSTRTIKFNIDVQ